LQVLVRLVARGLCVAQIGLGLLDLGGLGGREEIGELIACLLQEAARLIDGGPVVGVVLLEQRLAFYDPVAPRDMDGGDETRLSRRDLDEVRLRIALPGDRLRRSRAEERPSARQDNRRKRRRDNDSTKKGGARVWSGLQTPGLAGGHTLRGIST